MMDVVYRYRRPHNTDEIRYSLRSLTNISHDNVWIVGESPGGWVKDVNQIAVSQNGANKWINSRINLRVACENSDVSDDFILMDDDFYIMQPLDEIPILHRGPVSEAIQWYKNKRVKSRYVAGLIETVEILRYFGLSESFDLNAYNLHIPMIINKKKMLECLDSTEKLMPKTVPACLHIRTFYGNYWQIGGEKAEDVKVRRGNSPIPKGPFISTSDGAFNWTGKLGVKPYLQKAFSAPGPYEIGAPADHEPNNVGRGSRNYRPRYFYQRKQG